tara:strand:- start:4532 stop:4942 length:411 start_codon:yes stop_codon:yes gene_type:complete
MTDENKVEANGTVNEAPVEVPEVPPSELKMPTGTVAPSEPESASKMIWVLVIGAVVFLLGIGGFYIWQMSDGGNPVETADEVEKDVENNELAETSESTPPSDEIEAIEADIEAVLVEDLDSDLAEIEAEIEAALAE